MAGTQKHYAGGKKQAEKKSHIAGFHLYEISNTGKNHRNRKQIGVAARGSEGANEE